MKGRKLKNLKQGEYFTLKPISEPKESQVYIRGEYDRYEQKYECCKFSDMCYSRLFKGDKEKEEEKDKEKEFHSFTHSAESAKRRFLGGTLGKGVVLLSKEQMDDLLSKLSIEEFDRYVSTVAECELSGKHYKKKSHYQAILDMAAKDRRINK